AIVADPLSGRAQREHLRVSARVVLADRRVTGLGEQRAVRVDEDGADGHLAAQRGLSRELERPAHPAGIFGRPFRLAHVRLDRASLASTVGGIVGYGAADLKAEQPRRARVRTAAPPQLSCRFHKISVGLFGGRSTNDTLRARSAQAAASPRSGTALRGPSGARRRVVIHMLERMTLCKADG